ncbi:MAG: hypothetical protein CMB67_01220 [Euryarchaeota archaeon]|nr:hypothetical protein [Euryarchaeota archaeon]
MELTRTIVILSHPIAAIYIIWLFFGQRKWRKEGNNLGGKERLSGVTLHEKKGDRITIASIGVVALAYISNAVRGIIDHGDVTALIVPGHFHGWSGSIGIALMIYLWSLGRRTKKARDSGEKFSRTKEIHGKLSDFMGLLVAIHAFLGFLYLLTIIN